MTQPRVSILHNLARSGGTILSRCLGCMERILLLSEIHPQGAQIVAQGYGPQAGLAFSPGVQATLWHHLSLETILGRSTPAIVAAPPEDFLAQIREIQALTETNNRHMVLRDWGHLDYIGIPFRLPDYQDALVQILEQEFELTHVYLIRHPVDQWASLSALSTFHQVTPEHFLKGYLQYLWSAEDRSKSGASLSPQILFKYESFLTDPDGFLQQISSSLGITYDPSWTERWQEYHQVTGDEQASRSRVDQIAPARRKYSLQSELKQRFEGSSDYHQILQITGYETVEISSR